MHRLLCQMSMRSNIECVWHLRIFTTVVSCLPWLRLFSAMIVMSQQRRRWQQDVTIRMLVPRRRCRMQLRTQNALRRCNELNDFSTRLFYLMSLLRQYHLVNCFFDNRFRELEIFVKIQFHNSKNSNSKIPVTEATHRCFRAPNDYLARQATAFYCTICCCCFKKISQ